MEKKKTSIDRVMETSIGLKRTMSTSSAIMVGVGGTIGTGLFLSSGDVISTAGPGGANIFMYSVICICQYRFRKRYIAEGGKVEDLPYRVPAYPLVPIAGVVAFGIMLIVTIMDPGERVAMAFCAVCYIVTYVIAHFYTKKHDVKAANLDL